MQDDISDFKSAISTVGGLHPPERIFADGAIHRFGRAKASWYVLHMDGIPAGAFGDWRLGINQKWCAKNGYGSTSPEQRIKIDKQFKRIEKTRSDTANKTALLAQSYWSKVTEASPDHPYLLNKNVNPHGIRERKGVLIIPLMTPKKEIKSLQFISANGDKRFLKGGKVKGNLFWIPGDKTLVLVEGFATGATIHEATGYTILISFNANNMQPVAEKIRMKYPGRPLIICGDNDQWTTKADGTPWNPGKEKVLSIAWKFNLKVAIAQCKDTKGKFTDYNDLHQIEGIEAVKKQIEAAKYPQEILLEECQENKGAAFRSENLEGLKRLKQRNLSSFRELRHELKKLQVGVVTLDQAMSGKESDFSEAGGEGLEHLDIAETVIRSFGNANSLYNQSFFWIWNKKGLWVKSDDRVFKQAIHSLVRGMDFRKSDVESILDMAKTEAFRPNHRFDMNTTAVNCLNGELYWAGGNWELREHKRENFRTTQIHVEYNPDATSPRFELFLLEVFEGDLDQAEKAFLICEALGYSLLSSTEYEKFFLLIGPGANGKSVLMDTLASLVGYEYVAAVQPSQFENIFQRAHLHGKLVNLVTEIAEGHEIADAQLKAIVSGEITTAEHKHKPPFDFQPYATCWFGSNHMPHTRDFSDALFRRAIIIPFNRTFQEHEQDKKLKSKLKDELPGILNLALEAIAGVFRHGEFTKTKSCERAKKEWRLNSDQVQQFANDECVLIPGTEIASGKLYKVYREWAADSGIKRTVNQNNFTVRMCRLGAEKAKGTGGIRLLAGIALKYHIE